MRLNSIDIDNFKNIRMARLQFSPKVNALLGNNGMGKSNLLDAIHYMSFTKSFTGVSDSMLTTRGEKFSMIRAEYTRRDNPLEVRLGMTAGRRKSLKRDGKEYSRLSEHIGLLPLVMVTPADIDLIRGSGDERRRWMDMVIAQTDPGYLSQLIRYNHNLEARNRLLRDGAVDHSLFDAVEVPMAMAAEAITEARRRFIDRLQPILAAHYEAIAGSGETIRIAYSGSMAEPGTTLYQLLDSARRRDEVLRHTSVGPHRDDMEMLLDDMPMRRTASQGQCKTFTIALRLAQYDFLSQATGLKPLLLLDDIFDKLDAERVERIMLTVRGPRIGQIFVTDTNRTHLDEIVHRTGGDFRLWQVQSGCFTPLD
ncbi:MAG: DNA replication and repair protein RecF [Muribaculaceae bacterium]|nr:DNA replication and repair protein RecF [Muribaculaceae bacterium]